MTYYELWVILVMGRRSKLGGPNCERRGSEGKCLTNTTLVPLTWAVVLVGFVESVRFLENSASWKGLSALCLGEPKEAVGARAPLAVKNIAESPK